MVIQRIHNSHRETIWIESKDKIVTINSTSISMSDFPLDVLLHLPITWCTHAFTILFAFIPRQTLWHVHNRAIIRDNILSWLHGCVQILIGRVYNWILLHWMLVQMRTYQMKKIYAKHICIPCRLCHHELLHQNRLGMKIWSTYRPRHRNPRWAPWKDQEHLPNLQRVIFSRAHFVFRLVLDTYLQVSIRIN